MTSILDLYDRSIFKNLGKAGSNNSPELADRETPKIKEASTSKLEEKAVPDVRKPEQKNLEDRNVPEVKKPVITSLEERQIPEVKKSEGIPLEERNIAEPKKDQNRISLEQRQLPEIKKADQQLSLESLPIREHKNFSPFNLEDISRPEVKVRDKINIVDLQVPEVRREFSGEPLEKKKLEEIRKVSDSFLDINAFGFTPNMTLSDIKIVKDGQNPGLPSTGFTSPHTSFDFNTDPTVSGILNLWEDQSDGIYGRFSNKTMAFGGEEPFIEIKPNSDSFLLGARRKDSRSVPFASFIRDEERLTKFLLSGRGLRFTIKQFALQLFNPTAETRIWNPLSILLSAAPYVNAKRHFAISDSIGINLPFDVDRYEKAIQLVPSVTQQSRTAFQVPVIPNSTEYPGAKYAEKGRDTISNKSNLKLHDPNRYVVPGPTDIFSSLLGGNDSLEQKSQLASLAQKYTQSTGFTPIKLGGDISSIKNLLPGILTSIIPAGVIRIVANLLGFGALKNLVQGEIKFFNKHNPTFWYAPGLLNNENVNPVFNILNEEDNTGLVYGDSASPLVDVLNSLNAASTVGSSTVKSVPFTFKSLDKLSGQVETTSDDTRLTTSPQDGVRTISHLQTYADIVSKRKSKQQGSLNNDTGLTNLTSDATFYEDTMLKLEQEGETKTVFRSYAMADGGRKIDRDKFYDKVNALFPDEDYVPGEIEDFIPFKFVNATTGKILIFRATPVSINENIGSEFNSKKYIGRADRTYTYTGGDRKLSFSFAIFPYTERELEPLWLKLNDLAGMCFPTYKSIGSAGQYMIPPFIKFTLGDMYKDVPSILESISITVDDDAPWEIRDGDQVFDQFENAVSIGKLPRLIRVSVSLGIINKTLPTSNSRYFDPSFITESRS